MTYSFKKLNVEPVSVDNHNLDFVEMKQLHNTLFPNTDASFEWFEWYFGLAKHATKVAATRVYGAYHENKLVGMWCVEPKAYVTLQGRELVGRAFATGIHADHRRHGLFTELSKFAIASEKELKQYSWILGFPQVGRPVINAHEKAGWQHVRTIHAMGWTPCKTDWRVSLAGTAINDWKNVEKIEPFEGGFHEPLSYKRIRWNEHPDHSYATLMLDISGERSCVTIKQYGSVWHVLDVFGSSYGVTNVLRAAQTLAYRHKATELTIWCADNEAYKLNIVHVGFDKIARGTPSVEMLAVPIVARNIDALRTHSSHVQMGVEEIY